MSSTARRVQLIVISTTLLAHVVQAQSKPYSLDNITDLLRGGVSSEHVLALATQSCISFRITPETENSLRAAAAGDVVLIAALRSVCYRDPVRKGDKPIKPPTKVNPKNAVKVDPVRPGPNTSPTTSAVKYFRYLLSTRTGDQRPAGELKTAPHGGAPYYAVETDRLGRIARIVTYAGGKPSLDSRWYYAAGRQLPDSIDTFEGDRLLSASGFERDGAGNRLREMTYSDGKPVFLYRRTTSKDSVVRESEYIPDHSRGTTVVLFYSASGILSRMRYRTSNLQFEDGNSETTGYFESQAVTDSLGETHEQRYSYDENAAVKSMTLLVNGKLICTFSYEWKSPGLIRRTEARDLNGVLLAEYPDVNVTDVTSDGHPRWGNPTAGKIYKTNPWW